MTVAMAGIEDLRVEAHELRADIARLLIRQIHMDAEIAEIGAEVARGDISRASRSPELHAERVEIESKLRALRESLANVRARVAGQREAERKARFKEICEALESARAEVVEHTRAAAVALGRIEGLKREAIQLANAANAPTGGGGCWPHERSRIAELSGPINPYAGGDWINRHRYLPVDLDNTLRVKPVVEL